jgi:hypothetical protein
MPLPVLGFIRTDVSSSAFHSVLATTLRIFLLEVNLVSVPVPVWVQYITGTGIPFKPVPVMYCADTGTFWSSTSIRTVHYRYWH